MANFNTLIKRKQYIWLGLILAGGAAAVGRRAVSVRSEHEL
ncbi:conjugal transfer pilus assembly protein TraB [Klebsiella pneumoniae]|nr:conjugal transfer pilus assembly protein TraB [Klebsiella pneumoniae]